MIALFFYSLKRNRFIAFGIAFYLVNLLLILQVISVGSAVIAERYTYIPYIGLFFIAGWLIDRFAETNFSAWALQGSFKLICDSEKGPAATAVLRQACESTLALSSRQGIILTVLLYAWAAIHYLVGAVGLSQEMSRTAPRID